jgi:hypothetical protein
LAAYFQGSTKTISSAAAEMKLGLATQAVGLACQLRTNSGPGSVLKKGICRDLTGSNIQIRAQEAE